MVHPGAYRGNKRQKELKRLQKQQEKREKRLQKKAGSDEPESEFLVEGPFPGPAEESTAPGEHPPAQDPSTPPEPGSEPSST